MIQLARGTYFGDQRAAHQVGGVRFSENEYQANERIPWHAHGEAFITIAARGGFLETSTGNRSAVCLTGTAVWHPDGDSHRDEFGKSGGLCFGIEFDNRWVNRFREGASAPGSWTVARSDTSWWLCRQISRELTSADSLSILALEGLICALVAELARSPAVASARPPWLDRAVERLKSEFRDPPGVSELAAAASVHRSHFARIFHSHEGCTVAEYVRRERINFACTLLRSRAELGISDIALTAGFADQAHFSRAFRRVTARTPGEFRRRQAIEKMLAP